MAAIPFENIISSKPFRFLVGPQERDFVVHEAVFASISHRLGALMNGSLKEAQERSAKLDSVEEHTFVQFSEFAYTGNYSTSRATCSASSSGLVSKKVPITHETTPNFLIGSGTDDIPLAEMSLRPKQKKSKTSLFEAPPSKKDELWARFQSFAFTRTDPSFDPAQNHDNSDCAADMLLPHAQLYAFADQNLVTELKDLTLFKFHATLCLFRLTEQGAQGIAKLIEYTYANTPASGVGDRTLREVVTLYATCHLEKLWDSSAFQEVLLSQNEFARDLIGMMRERLS